MNFHEYWDSLFKDAAVAFVKTPEGKTIPVRIGDREICRHFWVKAGTECMKVVQESKL